ncbi:MAG: hypothetical protein EKK55_17240 [Rhodocyclaceae bacterium]|nr:MAG: hypothetical protein EKK55_17240 [Rhodocyclaceae bacterium]
MTSDQEENGWSEEPFKKRVWNAIDDIRRDQLITQEKLKVIERDFMKQGDFCQIEQGRWESLQDKLSERDARLIKIESMVQHLVETMDAYWKFPFKVLLFIGALGSAGLVVWKLAKGLASLRVW